MSRRTLPEGARVASFTALSLRSLRARPLRAVLTAGAVVLGVGMVFGVLLLVGTIHSTFGQLYDQLYGRTDIVVSGKHAVGSMPQGTIDRVRAVRGVDAASGSVYSVFRTVGRDGTVSRGRTAQLYTVGVDFTQPDMTSARVVAGREPLPGRREIEVARDWAASHDLGVGDPVRLSTPTGLVTLRVSGLFEFRGGLNLGGYGTASMPVDVARRVMDKPAIWDEIDVKVNPGAGVDTVKDRLSSTLGSGVDVATPKAKRDEMQSQLASLDVVLYFFSGIALFVGAFLILNSFNMTVFQRMREIGTLRALGASHGRVARSILAEAAILGVAGSVVGLALGAGLAVVLVRSMRSFGLPVGGVAFSSTAVVAALATGIVATLGGAAWPAVRAGRIPPIRALLGGTTRRSVLTVRRAVVGLALFTPGLAFGGLLWFGNNSNDPLLGLLGALLTMVMFLGMVRLAPFLVVPIVRLMARPLRRMMPAEGRLAADAALANPGRTAATAATLLVALSVVVVNATVASSFVGSVRTELDKRYARDLTVQPVGYQAFGGPQPGISRGLRTQIAALPEAGAVARLRATYVTALPGSSDTEGLIIAFDPAEYARVDAMSFKGATRAQAFAGLAAGGVVPGTAYAKAEGLEVGDRVRLTGPSGTRVAPVVATADLYDTGGDAMQMSLGTMAAVYGVRTDQQLAVKAASPGVRDALAQRVDRLLAREYPGLESLSNAEIKQDTEDAINQQFAFFNAIVAIAVLVGGLGIINTLTMSVLERTREIGVLRALGATRWRVRRTMADESLLISVAGTLAGILAGLLVAVVWIVAMRAGTFPGMTMHLPAGTLLSIAVLGVVIGVLAAIVPARRAARLDPLTALHYE